MEKNTALLNLVHTAWDNAGMNGQYEKAERLCRLYIKLGGYDDVDAEKGRTVAKVTAAEKAAAVVEAVAILKLDGVKVAANTVAAKVTEKVAGVKANVKSAAHTAAVIANDSRVQEAFTIFILFTPIFSFLAGLFFSDIVLVRVTTLGDVAITAVITVIFAAVAMFGVWAMADSIAEAKGGLKNE